MIGLEQLAVIARAGPHRFIEEQPQRLAQVGHDALVEFRECLRVFIDGLGLVQLQPVMKKMLQLRACARVAQHAIGLRADVLRRTQIAVLNGDLKGAIRHRIPKQQR